MPLAIAVGRRIVILGSTMILIVGAVLCAVARTYEWHLAARMILGLCAGQSEALVPMITQVRSHLPYTRAKLSNNPRSFSSFMREAKV